MIDEISTWNIIDSFFKREKNYITIHHLDSFNEFINNRINNTIETLNPFITLKNDEFGNLKFEVHVWVGGKNSDEIFITKPTIFENNKQKPLYPNEARLKDMTYKSDVYANIYVDYKIHNNDKSVDTDTVVFNNVKLGSIPIMLHSKLCVLNNQPDNVIREMGDCPYDHGGYFIIDGKEKAIISQERIATNKLFINKSTIDEFTFDGLVRSTSEENPLFPKSVKIASYSDFRFKGERENAIVIRMPNIDKDIPLFILFRALGIESDKEILETILYDIEDDKNKALKDMLRYSVIDSNFIYSQEESFNYLSKFTEFKTKEHVKWILVNDLFPNMGTKLHNKAMYLGHIINKFVKVMIGVKEPVNRDDFKFKRVDVSGFLLGNLFRDFYNKFRNNVRNIIDQQFTYGSIRVDNINQLINKNNIFRIFDSNIIEQGMIKSMKSDFGLTGDTSKQGIVQDLNRLSYVGYLSHIRRVNTPMDRSIKITGPHKLHGSQWGYMCPSDTPDGQNVGLHKHLSVGCHITKDSGTENIIKILNQNKVIKLDNLTPADIKQNTKIILNGNWYGIVEEPQVVMKKLKSSKFDGTIDIYTGIAWNILDNEIIINTDSGRVTRPVYKIEENKHLITDSLMKKIKENNINWNELTTGKDSPIEYIDSDESNTTLIAMYQENLEDKKSLKRYTHMEIHPSIILSLYINQIPFAHHNQAPRNIFSTQQAKQALNIYATNFNNRIDTTSLILHYPQKPLVTTRYNKYNYSSELPNGENLIVAITTYTGYNQEDSIIVNKNSVERGMFNITKFSSHIEDEIVSRDETQRIIFCNPEVEKENGQDIKLKISRWDKIDANGIPILNKKIKENDVYVGRCRVESKVLEDKDNKDIFKKVVRKQIYSDKSVIADKTVSGFIDKAMLYQNPEGLRRLKIRFRKTKIVEPGDKMCCYDNQTDILTNRGFIKFSELENSDLVATLVDDKLVYQKPVEIQKYEHNGLMYRVDSNQVDLLVTGNHRMYTRTRNNIYKMEYADDIFGKIRYYKKNIDTEHNKDYQFILPAHDKQLDKELDMDNFLLYLGMWYSEGWAYYNEEKYRYTIGICIHKERIRNILEYTIQKMGYKKGHYDCKNNVYYITDKQLSYYMKTLSVGAINKQLPEWVWKLSKRQSNILLEGLMLGDGNTYDNGYKTHTMRYDTSSVKLRDDVQRLSLMCGYSANYYLKEKAGLTKITKDGTKISSTVDHYRLTIVQKQNEPIINKYKYSKDLQDKYENYNDYVYCCTVPEGEGVLYVRRNGKPVWSGNSRMGQKGVCGLLMNQEDMPRTKDGIVPDIIINPHAFPSRMTIGHLIECPLAKFAALSGITVDGTIFDNHNIENYYDELGKMGFDKYGNEILYNGYTGQQMDSEIFFGPTFYERLKHMVSDKVNWRSTGPITSTTKQPVKGRGNGGGLRIGEMESNSLFANGIFSFLKESMLERSDKYTMLVDNKSGTIAKIDSDTMEYITTKNNDSKDFSFVQLPFAFKLLMQEMEAMGVSAKLDTQLNKEKQELIFDVVNEEDIFDFDVSDLE